MRVALFLVMFLPGCFSLTGDGYRAWMAERFAPAELVAEKLILEFEEDRIIVLASFLFRTHDPASLVSCFPGKGYPVRHGVRDLPRELLASPENMEVFYSGGAGLTLETPARTKIQVFTRSGSDGVSHEFVTDFSNLMTRIDIKYKNRWQTLTDGRRMFAYILTSGALWRGSIGALTVIERGRRTHGVMRVWPRAIPQSRVEPDFDLVYLRPAPSSGGREAQ